MEFRVPSAPAFTGLLVGNKERRQIEGFNHGNSNCHGWGSWLPLEEDSPKDREGVNFFGVPLGFVGEAVTCVPFVLWYWDVFWGVLLFMDLSVRTSCPSFNRYFG